VTMTQNYGKIWWFDESNIKEHAFKGMHAY
jgi:hypothetical protein